MLAGLPNSFTEMPSSDEPDHLAPTQLRVEHLEEPFGIDVARPRLSWWLPFCAREQRAYRLRTNDWDSGRVDSDQHQRRRPATRARGFALDQVNRRNGLTQVAVPLFSQSGSLALVLTAADFGYAMTEEKIDEVARAMLAFSDCMSSELVRLRLD